jgi:hypothetical protein
MPQTSQKEVTVRLRGKFAFQIAGIENRLAGLMQAGFAGINHEIYRTLVTEHHSLNLIFRQRLKACDFSARTAL